jgi:Ion channel
MQVLGAVLGGALIIVVLWDAFETVVLPRRVVRRVRLTRIFYRVTWQPWAALADWLLRGRRRETYLSFYGPLSLLFLMWVWAAGLVLGFALVDWGTGSGINAQGQTVGFAEDLYLSGTTFFTLGLGDVIPRTPLARALTVVESGMGFGFLALVIGYLPVLYQSFSRREVNITLLDARAGSPPSAGELLRRHSTADGLQALQEFLHDSERWAAELLESHISYPLLAYFRSQHANQSWLGALTTILDASALVMVGVRGACARQAQLTFAIARHAVVDLAQIFGTPPRVLATDRLPAADWSVLRARLTADGLALPEGPDTEARLLELRQMYEPYVNVLSNYLRLSVPPWMPAAHSKDNWQTSAWRQAAGAPAPCSAGTARDHHF